VKKNKLQRQKSMLPTIAASLLTRRLVGDRTSTVSTAQLKASLPLHMRPINLVVYQGSLVFRQACLISRGASRLDAFSGYPCRA